LEEGSDDPNSVRGCYINGFYDTVELSYPERLYGFPQHAQRMINLPDVQNMKVVLNGKVLKNPIEYERILDTSEGLTKRHLKYKVNSGKISITFTRVASFTCPEMFLTILEIESENVSGELEIRTGINCDVQNYTNPDDPRVAAEAIKHFHMEKAEKLPDGGFVKCRTSGSGLTFAIVQRLRIECNEDKNTATIETGTNETGIEATLKKTLTAGTKITIEKYNLFSDSRRQKDPKRRP